MQPGNLYINPNGQKRLVLGFAPDGRVAYASAGKTSDYTSCQVQDQAAFEAAGTLDHRVSPGELARVQTTYSAWMAAKGVGANEEDTDEDGEPLDPDAEIKDLAERNNLADENPPGVD